MKGVFYASGLAELTLFIKISKQKLEEPTWNRKNILIFELFAKVGIEILNSEIDLLKCISHTKHTLKTVTFYILLWYEMY